MNPVPEDGCLLSEKEAAEVRCAGAGGGWHHPRNMGTVVAYDGTTVDEFAQFTVLMIDHILCITISTEYELVIYSFLFSPTLPNNTTYMACDTAAHTTHQ